MQINSLAIDADHHVWKATLARSANPIAKQLTRTLRAANYSLFARETRVADLTKKKLLRLVRRSLLVDLSDCYKSISSNRLRRQWRN